MSKHIFPIICIFLLFMTKKKYCKTYMTTKSIISISFFPHTILYGIIKEKKLLRHVNCIVYVVKVLTSIATNAFISNSIHNYYKALTTNIFDLQLLIWKIHKFCHYMLLQA